MQIFGFNISYALATVVVVFRHAVREMASKAKATERGLQILIQCGYDSYLASLFQNVFVKTLHSSIFCDLLWSVLSCLQQEEWQEGGREKWPGEPSLNHDAFKS